MPGLDDFFAGVRPVSDSSPGGTPAPAARSGEPADEQSGDEAPSGVVEVELPTGIQVYFQAAPKRLYRIRQLLQPKEKFADWVEVPSISKITDILDKPGLVHWGEKVGINLVQELLRNEWIAPHDIVAFKPNEDRHPQWWGGDHLQQIGKTKKLTGYHMKDAAASRGTSVHQALEGWAMSGQLANPDVFPEHEQGYVLGLNRFLVESKFEPRMSEVIVASIEHEVAGRFDLLGDIPKPVELTHHLTAKNEYRKTFVPCSGLVDLKTSTGVYVDHQFQVAGYKGCITESGYDEPEKGFVLRVTRDGRYELIEVKADWMGFWFLRGLYDAINQVEQDTREGARKGAK